MANFPSPSVGGNSGNGYPLILGDQDVIGDLFTPGSALEILDWDGDGKSELVSSGGTGDITVFKYLEDTIDGTPIFDRGTMWGELSRSNHRDDNDKGLTGSVIAAADFDGDGVIEVILAPRGYSKKPIVVFKLNSAAPTTRADQQQPNFVEPENMAGSVNARSAAVCDWNGDGKPDLVVCKEIKEGSYIDKKTGVAPEDQRDRYKKDGSWLNPLGRQELHLYENTSSKDKIEFTYRGKANVDLPRHSFFVSCVHPDKPELGLLVSTYYGEMWNISISELGIEPAWNNPVELLTTNGAPFNRSVNIQASITVTDLFEKERFDILTFDQSANINWFKSYGFDKDGRPVYSDPVKIKQYDPYVNGGNFSVPTVGDWRGTGNSDLLVGSVEGYIFWYKTISTKPLRFAKPVRVKQGTEEIRRLARANPSAGHHWGGSQTPYDGDTGGYSNPVLSDWNGNGLLDLVVSDMIGLYDWYPNWGTKTDPELGPPQRIYMATGEPLFGPWRQQPGIGDFTGNGLPDVVIQDSDLDLALYRRVGIEDVSVVLPGEKLLYEDGSTIKTHGVYTPGGGDGRGRTKINVVDWDGDGLLDLLIGVGPQGGSPYSSYVLFAKNVGTNEAPVFKRPDVLLWNQDGNPLEFWRHGVHMAPVDWDGDGKYELVAGADTGYVWYWNADNFGTPKDGNHTAPVRPEDRDGSGGLG